jgi:hypothetical protein
MATTWSAEAAPEIRTFNANRQRLLVLAVCLLFPLAGCLDADDSGSESEPEAPPEPGATPMEFTVGQCFMWRGIVDAPASTFPSGTGFQPVAGTTPGSIQFQFDAIRCPGADAEFWEGWPVSSGGILLDAIVTGNETRSHWYAAVNATVELAQVQGFFNAMGPYHNQDGVGRNDGSHVVFVRSLMSPAAIPGGATYRLQDGTATISWTLLGPSNYQQGTAQVGTSAVVAPGHWHGQGHRMQVNGIIFTAVPTQT